MRALTLLSILIAIVGLHDSAISFEPEQVILKIDDVKFISTLKYYWFDVSDFVLGESGQLEVALKNGTAILPKVELHAEII